MLKRDPILDTAKVIGVILVVFAHLYPTYSNERLYIYSFHMPLFFILSGLVHRYDGTIHICKYTKKLIYPCALFFFLFSLIYIPLILCGILNGAIELCSCLDKQPVSIGGGILCYFKYNINALIFGTDSSNVVLWFLFALFYCKTFTDIILKYKFSVFFFLLLFIVILLSRKSLFYCGQGLMALPFYIIGHLSKTRYQNFVMINKIIITVIAISLVFINIFITSINGRISMSGLMFGNISFFPLRVAVFYINALLGSLGIIMFSILLKKSFLKNYAKSLVSILGLQMIPILVIIQCAGAQLPYIVSFSYSLLIILILHNLHNYLINKLLI